MTANARTNGTRGGGWRFLGSPSGLLVGEVGRGSFVRDRHAEASLAPPPARAATAPSEPSTSAPGEPLPCTTPPLPLPSKPPGLHQNPANWRGFLCPDSKPSWKPTEKASEPPIRRIQANPLINSGLLCVF